MLGDQKLFSDESEEKRAWASMSDKKWESTIPVTGSAHVLGGAVVSGHVLASNSDRNAQYAVVDVTTGEAKPIETTGRTASPRLLADGWLVYGNNHHGPAVPNRPRPTEPTRATQIGRASCRERV